MTGPGTADEIQLTPIQVADLHIKAIGPPAGITDRLEANDAAGRRGGSQFDSRAADHSDRGAVVVDLDQLCVQHRWATSRRHLAVETDFIETVSADFETLRDRCAGRNVAELEGRARAIEWVGGGIDERENAELQCCESDEDDGRTPESPHSGIRSNSRSKRA